MSDDFLQSIKSMDALALLYTIYSSPEYLCDIYYKDFRLAIETRLKQLEAMGTFNGVQTYEQETSNDE